MALPLMQNSAGSYEVSKLSFAMRRTLPLLFSIPKVINYKMTQEQKIIFFKNNRYTTLMRSKGAISVLSRRGNYLFKKDIV